MMKKNDYQNPEMTVIGLLPQQIICISKGAYDYDTAPSDVGLEWESDGVLDTDDV